MSLTHKFREPFIKHQIECRIIAGPYENGCVDVDSAMPWRVFDLDTRKAPCIRMERHGPPEPVEPRLQRISRIVRRIIGVQNAQCDDFVRATNACAGS